MCWCSRLRLEHPNIVDQRECIDPHVQTNRSGVWHCTECTNSVSSVNVADPHAWTTSAIKEIIAVHEEMVIFHDKANFQSSPHFQSCASLDSISGVGRACVCCSGQ